MKLKDINKVYDKFDKLQEDLAQTYEHLYHQNTVIPQTIKDLYRFVDFFSETDQDLEISLDFSGNQSFLTLGSLANSEFLDILIESHNVGFSVARKRLQYIEPPFFLNKNNTNKENSKILYDNLSNLYKLFWKNYSKRYDGIVSELDIDKISDIIQSQNLVLAYELHKTAHQI